MTIIASGNGFAVHSPQGHSILEGSVTEGQEGPGASYSISVNHSSDTYRYDTVWVWIGPAGDNNYADFWSYDTPLISGTPSWEELSFVRTNDPDGMFGSLSIILNADRFAEGDETYKIALYDSPVRDRLFLETTFTIVDDDILRGTANADVIEGTSSADWIEGYGGADTLVGLAGHDNLYGGSGDDTLDGGIGADQLIGGSGSDLFIVDNGSDVVVEVADQGKDTVRSSVSYTLNDHVENLALIGSANLNGTGNSLANGITGNAGSNHLQGFVGNDTLDGGSGGDTLDGGTGRDQLIGGAGNDLFIVDNGSDVVVEAADQGKDTVRSSVSYTLNDHVENLALIGSAHLNGTGNSLANGITGNAGSNSLNGLDGNDRLVGGAGNDTLIGGAGNDTLNGGAGSDTGNYASATDAIKVDLGVHSAQTIGGGQGSDTLISIENLTGSRFADRLTGNAGANQLMGSAGNDTLSGLAGNDQLMGGAGKDTLIGGAGNDTLNGGAGSDTGNYASATGAIKVDLGVRSAQAIGGGQGSDTLISIENLTGSRFADRLTGNAGANQLMGSAGNDTLSGLAGNDQLMGGAGKDTLIGGGGKDTLTGDAGADTFVFKTIQEAGKGAARDVITDFVSGVDTLQLSAIDANTTRSGNQAFEWAGGQAEAYSVWSVKSGNNRIVRGDTNGDEVFDFEIQLNGVSRLTDDDFIL